METELVGDFSSVHGVREILLVGKNEEVGGAELILIEHALKLLTGLGYTLTIVGVDHEDDALSILEVCRAGQGRELIRTSENWR